MSAGPLVSPGWLRDHLDDPAVLVADVAQEKDQESYDDWHIPGAQRWYWKDVVWDARERQFATPELLASRLGERGVGDGRRLVLYAVRNQYAIYCYWAMTELCGFREVHVLDGGKVRWGSLGYPVSTGSPDVVACQRSVPRRDRCDRSRVGRDELLARLRDGTSPRLLDARYPEELEGLRVKPGTGFDHGAERHGHIPGAVNVPYERYLAADGAFRPVDELAGIFESAGAAPDQTDDVVTYCRLGHRASLTWFVATELLGYAHVRIYDGSWTEWGSMVGAPVER